MLREIRFSVVPLSLIFSLLVMNLFMITRETLRKNNLGNHRLIYELWISLSLKVKDGLTTRLKRSSTSNIAANEDISVLLGDLKEIHFIDRSIQPQHVLTQYLLYLT